MENCNIYLEQKSLINELAQGKELARQLQIHLNAPSSSHGTRELLVQKIIVSFENALSLMNSSSSHAPGGEQQPTGAAAIRMVELSSPHSLDGSPRSEDSDREFKDQDHRDPSRKRKNLTRWTKQIRVTSGMGLEGPLDDGFSWRKYGQKDILGAKYPRGYYRCTHRNVQGCLATKQVQRSDEDPTIFEITYRGRHKCTQATSKISTTTPPSSSSPLPENPEQHNSAFDPQQNQQQSQDMLLNIPQGLRVITEGLDTREEMFPSFNYPSTLNVKVDQDQDQVSLLNPMVNNNHVGNLSPPLFMSPAAACGAPCYFSASLQGFGGNYHNFQIANQSDIAEIISAPTSATNSPTVGLDFPFGQADHSYPNFTFDDPQFFS